MTAGRFAGLDGIRALAVSAVVWHHTHGPVALLPMSRNGFLGVDVFFVLSGFLISTLLLRERDETGRISLRRFYIRRSLRIFPLYYLVLALLSLYFVAAGSGSSQRAWYLAELPYHATYTSNWVDIKSLMAITWSLSTEEQFYLVWPPLLVLLRRCSIPLLLAVLGLSQVVNFGVVDSWLASHGLPYSALPILQCTFAPIVLGALLAFVLHAQPLRRQLHQRLPRYMPIIAFALMIAAANIGGDIRGLPRLVFQLASTAFIAAVVLRPSDRIVRILEWRPLAYLGTISYGVYLLHMIVVDVVRRLMAFVDLHADSLVFVTCLIGTIALSAASFRYFERPLLRIKNRFH